MPFILSLIAILFSWIFIEIFILSFILIYKEKKDKSYLTLKKFKLLIRTLIIILFALVVIYMYFFQTEELRTIIILCIGFIK